METQETITTKQRNVPLRLTIWAVVVAAILSIPFLANAPWTSSDFIFAGIVLFGCATTYELVTRNMKDAMQRVIVGVAVLFFIVLVLAWAAAGPD